MATTYNKFTGKCSWARLIKPDEKYNKWSINVYLDEKGLAQFDKLGLQLKKKKDEVTNETYVTFARPKEKLINGDIVTFDKPKVTYQGEEFDGIVGNGSTVKVDVAVYNSRKGPGHRLESVEVIDLVEFVPEPKQEDSENASDAADVDLS